MRLQGNGKVSNCGIEKSSRTVSRIESPSSAATYYIPPEAQVPIAAIPLGRCAKGGFVV